MKKTVFIVTMMASASAFCTPYNLHVPSDPKAKYTVLETGTSGDLKTIVTKREGKAGISYSQRAYDCQHRLVKYLGSGESIEQMKSSKPDEKLAPITEESIAWYVGQEACK
ncbi:hypothetical protein [Klebsiella quasipneumoniae]|uniref:hypothetical protein n=1 Tax=Klebsiella quasipneumoniae TaxID=1463165 RepID=UPI00190EF643|nr:hypothetical protein [Klebsiella quasipneumoniae]